MSNWDWSIILVISYACAQDKHWPVRLGHRCDLYLIQVNEKNNANPQSSENNT